MLLRSCSRRAEFLRLDYLAAAVLALELASLPAAGQPLLVFPGTTPTAAEQPVEPKLAEDPLASKREENAALLRLAQRKLDLADPNDGAAAQEVALLKTVDLVLAQQTAIDQQLKDLDSRQAELTGQLQSLRANGIPPDTAMSFIDLDRLKDELATEQVRAGLMVDKLTAAKTSLEKAQSALDDAERKRRQSQEALEAGKQGPNASQLATAAEQARQAARLAAETLALRRKELAREELAQRVQRQAIDLLKERVARVSPLVVFSDADLGEQIDQIKKQEDALNASLLRAQGSLQSAERRVLTAQQELDEATDDRDVLTEKLEARRRGREKLSDEIDTLTQQLQRLAQLRVAWNRRFSIAKVGASAIEKQSFDMLKTWQRETRTIIEELASDTRAQILRMRDLRGSLSTLSKKMESVQEAPEGIASWLELQRTRLDETLRIHEAQLVSNEAIRRVHEKLLDEIGSNVLALSPTQLALGAWHQAEQIWNYEITRIDDRSITVRKIVTGILLFVVGWILSRFLSVVFANRLLRRFRLSKDATAAIRTLVFYVLLVIVTLVALRTVNVPLTAFTILGGALAIGVGFGSQALITNFIGGLIMLAERPVRLGERIKYGNFDGVVEEVGFRCTKLRTLTDHLVTIPNSTLVNDSIENISRRRTIRRLLNLTITYDTPREKIAEAVQALRDILAEREFRERIHPIVGFEELPPRVVFNEFNAESLNIMVIYWYAPPEWWEYMDHCERLNFRILEEFEKLGVDFAFPSRTVYLAGDPRRELAVRLLPAEASTSVPSPYE